MSSKGALHVALTKKTKNKKHHQQIYATSFICMYRRPCFGANNPFCTVKSIISLKAVTTADKKLENTPMAMSHVEMN